MDMVPGFELTAEAWIAEYATQARRYRHRKTGADILSLENNDENKVFGITFRTPPADSTGIAHILEHSVLCGSRKYPVKEPFVELLKGSLHTFLNAFTYPDKTCYPIASTHPRDFYHLADVYLDAVFHPRLTPDTLRQEGWRYEFDAAGRLQRQGVVYNEMKGVYSSPDALLGELSQRSLFPDTPYGHDSGGDPEAIPQLTFAQFLDFHRRHYHPSNARIFFCGDDDPAARLRLLAEYLDEFDARPPDSDIPLQPAFREPRRIVRPVVVAPDSPDADRGFFTMNWRWPEPLDLDRAFALGLLNYALAGNSAAPLWKALIDSGLGEEVAGGGLNGELRQMFFSIGLRGIRPADVPAAEQVVWSTLRALARDGLPDDLVAAGLNAMEFSLRENNTGGFPRGLALMLRALNVWLYDGDPLPALAFEKPLAVLQRRVRAEPRSLEGLIETWLLENPHHTVVILTPDPALAGRRETAARAELDAQAARWTAAERERVAAEAAALRRKQETPDDPADLARIPTLQPEDLPRADRPIETRPDGAVAPALYLHPQETRGITYFTAGFPLDAVPADLWPWLPLFVEMLLESGAGAEDFVDFSRRVDRCTGGLSVQLSLSDAFRGPEPAAWLFLRGKALARQMDDLLEISHIALREAHLDNEERFFQMALESKAGQEAELIPAGHQVIMGRLAAAFSRAARLREATDGVEQLAFLRRLIAAPPPWSEIRNRLETLRDLLIRRDRMVINLTADPGDLEDRAARARAWGGGFPDGAPVASGGLDLLERRPLALTIPAQVNYLAKMVSLREGGFAFHGSQLVAVRYVSAAWLWDRVRVRGGAYGAFCRYSRATGMLSMLSYRDPRHTETLAAFDSAAEFLRRGEFSEADIRRAIIGAISDLDAYQLPDAKGHTGLMRRLTGDDDAARQRMREEILGTTRSQVRDFSAALDYLARHGVVGLVGPESSAAAVARDYAPDLQIQPLMSAES